ncbi:hypothetical protein AB0F13_20965 [Streptomyces sp. NPDC026206]|uniref:hypothetical protein n=1 Tax=Streptomyces sp. NPDC026206 TaxID=3157089 RepID=UPI0033D82A34
MGEEHIGALTREGEGHGPADARVPACDDRTEPLQPAGAAVGVLTVIGARPHVIGVAGVRLVLLGVLRPGVTLDGVDVVLC